MFHADSQAGIAPGEDDYNAGRTKGIKDMWAHPDWTEGQIREAANSYSAIWLMNPDRALKRLNGYLTAFGLK